ncbi:hypothetical protein Pla163_17900 [Planctomycetes bacterium Pla163]|uniref:PDZ domain-containing protein n=1 Tax=Rohdeia mirabilis TaxID=2528008 RepID=A0A518CZN0_9BACT|nr:hypothetical protein Pla163_17900 [Planctomycetes bacterium Pla163]
MFDRTHALLTAASLAFLAAPALAQVHYHEDGGPWNQRASAGPDAVVPGWYYNLGITGLRVELVEDAPCDLVVRYVFEGSPAAGKVRVGDHIVGAGGARFETPHRNGYGMDVFGPNGPLLDFAVALEEAQTKAGKGVLELVVERVSKDGDEPKERNVDLRVGTRYGAFGPSFPDECKKSDRIVGELLDQLVEQQREDGSWGLEPRDVFAPLALLASGERKYRPAVEKCARFHARTTSAEDEGGLINWRYMGAAIVLAEYYLATGEKWVLPELEEIRDFLVGSQYMSLAQRNPRVKESHPGDWPTDPMDSHGGWGHNPGFEGYGPIAMLTGQGALALSLIGRCGVEVDRARIDAALAFVDRGSGANGYVWYGDEKGGGPDDWADMGRTGAAAIAYHLAPIDAERRAHGREHALVIGAHPESFPDTHGSPVMGMGYAALGAFTDPGSFRRLMDANRWWFALAQCQDGSFYYQPNRDNAGYGEDSRLSASAVTAFILTVPRRGLVLTGRGEER